MTNALQLHPKVTGGSLSGAVALIVIALLKHWNVHLDEVTASAITVVVGSVGAWLTPATSRLQELLDGPPPAPPVA